MSIANRRALTPCLPAFVHTMSKDEVKQFSQLDSDLARLASEKRWADKASARIVFGGTPVSAASPKRTAPVATERRHDSSDQDVQSDQFSNTVGHLSISMPFRDAPQHGGVHARHEAGVAGNWRPILDSEERRKDAEAKLAKMAAATAKPAASAAAQSPHRAKQKPVAGQLMTF